ncbi:MAG: helix-turn-helix domain-containing protein [Anaerolineales bacterium]
MREAISIDVGEVLKRLRQEKGMSLRLLAAKSGLSANALSMIERGRVSPSVSTLYKLADALGVSITAFFHTESRRQPVVFIKHDARRRVPFMRGLWEGLGGEEFIGRVEPFLITLESGASSGLFQMSHSGHEFVFCLRGQIEYMVEHNYYLLEAGDSLLFAAHLLHRWRNPGNTVANALIVLSGFSEQESLREMHFNSNTQEEVEEK